MTDVKAVLYKQTISDSVLDTIHGFQHDIFEIHIPKMKLFFNHAGIFAIHKGRYSNAEKLKVFYMTFESASYLKQALEATKKANKLKDDLLRDRVKLFKEQEKK